MKKEKEDSVTYKTEMYPSSSSFNIIKKDSINHYYLNQEVSEFHINCGYYLTESGVMDTVSISYPGDFKINQKTRFVNRHKGKVNKG